MEREQRIATAKETVHRLLGRYSKPHSRIHDDAALDNVNKLRALEGLCGECDNLKLEFPRKDGKDRVFLDCSKGHSPLALYENTPLGEQASCDGHAKKIRIALFN